MTRRKTLGAFALLGATLTLGAVATMGLLQPVDGWVVTHFALRVGESPDWLIATTQAISWTGGGAQRYGIVAVLAGLLLYWRGRSHALVMGLVPLLANWCSSLLKLLFDRPRPHLAPHLDAVSSASFPSSHATNAAAVYLLMLMLVPRSQFRCWLWPMLGLALATGASRIMLGVHYPSDVVGGWMLGGAAALIVLRFDHLLTSESHQ